jgi:hypothetical protein
VARKIQLVAFILGMVLVGVERFTASASAATPNAAQSPVYDGGTPIPPDMAQ